MQELNQSNYINIWLAMAVTYNLMNLGMNIIRMWKPTAPLALMVGNVVFDLVKWLVLAFMFVLIPFSIGMDVLYGADGIESCQEDQGVPAGEGNWRVLSALLFLFQTMVNAEGAYGCLWKSEPSMGDIELANGLAGVVLLVVFHAIVVFLLITMLVRRTPAQLWRNYGAIRRDSAQFSRNSPRNSLTPRAAPSPDRDGHQNLRRHFRGARGEPHVPPRPARPRLRARPAGAGAAQPVGRAVLWLQPGT